MKTKLEQLKKAIQLAVPEIMKLEMGCKVKHKKLRYFRTVVFVDKKYDIVQYMPKIYGEEAHDILEHYKDGKFEILGKNITLEDCLIAIEDPSISYRYFYKDKLHIQIEKKGKLLGIWELNKPLQKQSDKTIKFLHSLICK